MSNRRKRSTQEMRRPTHWPRGVSEGNYTFTKGSSSHEDRKIDFVGQGMPTSSKAKGRS